MPRGSITRWRCPPPTSCRRPGADRRRHPTRTSAFHAGQRLVARCRHRADQLRQRVAFALSEILVVSDTNATLGPGPTPSPPTTTRSPTTRSATSAISSRPPRCIRRWVTGSTCRATRRATSPPATIPTRTTAARSCSFSPSVSTACGRTAAWCSIRRATSCRPTTRVHHERFRPRVHRLDVASGPPGQRPAAHEFLSGDGLAQPDGHGQELPRTRDENPPRQRGAAAAVGYSPTASAVGGSQADTTTAAYDSYCSHDLEAALDSIFYHPNVGPYVCRQLIQRLVESNPSPAYLYRVVRSSTTMAPRRTCAATWPPSSRRSCSTARPAIPPPPPRPRASGKQREPLLRITGPGRTFLATANSGTLQPVGQRGDDRSRPPTRTTSARATSSGWTSAATTPAPRPSRRRTTRPPASTRARHPRARRRRLRRQRARAGQRVLFRGRRVNTVDGQHQPARPWAERCT